ncbi:MAG: hypothetical protein LBS63_00830 [Prevotellaceae bacterium]|jgi:Na+-transporting NADH:ubiquinone oxidoreductase subunit C|nr:hypothetical protein [Prevotellaceae bacterium]
MKKESKQYIFLYSVALAAVGVATLLVAASLLKPFQQKNVEVAKKQRILLAVHKLRDVKAPEASTARTYAKYITDTYRVSSLGAKIQGKALSVSLEAEMRKPAARRQLPVFVCTDSDSSLKYIFPVQANGLWGAVEGYVALHDDFSTIYGVALAPKSRTLMQGIENLTLALQKELVGRSLFDTASWFASAVAAPKGSCGMREGVAASLSGYLDFFREQRRLQKAAQRVLADKRQEEDEKCPVEPPFVPQPRVQQPEEDTPAPFFADSSGAKAPAATPADSSGSAAGGRRDSVPTVVNPKAN